MEAKTEKIIAAAFRLVKQHGYRKVTMSDIAEAAEMSRPTLYAEFANKEAIVEAMVARSMDDYDAQAASKLPRAKTLQAQLSVLFEIWVIAPFASVADSKGGRDLVGNIGTYVPAALDAVYTRLEARLVSILEAAMTGKRALPTRDLARIMTVATKGLKASAANVGELRRLIDGMIIMCIATA